jgi:uncharacterized membrane protein YhhN
MRKALWAYAVIAVAHLVSLAAGITWLEWVSKFLLVPSLALWVLFKMGARQALAPKRRGLRLVVAALVLCSLGDMALEFDSLFIAGMGLFAAGHACYVTFFLRSGAARGLRRRPWIPIGYAVVWLGLIALLWSGLGGLRIPVAAYSLLLTATAVTSAGFGARTGVGGALFFVSDGLISLRLADLSQPPMPGLWIMSTYIVAQYLLASGSLRATAPETAHPVTYVQASSPG